MKSVHKYHLEVSIYSLWWHGLALMPDGKIAFSYYNGNSNYLSLTTEENISWSAYYARLEMTYI